MYTVMYGNLAVSKAGVKGPWDLGPPLQLDEDMQGGLDPGMRISDM